MMGGYDVNMSSENGFEFTVLLKGPKDSLSLVSFYVYL